MFTKSSVSPFLTAEASLRSTRLRIISYPAPEPTFSTRKCRARKQILLGKGSRTHQERIWQICSAGDHPQVAVLDDQEKKNWNKSKQLLTALNFSLEEAETMLKKAFGWVHSPYWSEERKTETPNSESVTVILNYIGSLGLSDDELHKLLKKFPEVLGCDFEGEVKLNVGKLDSDWGITGQALKNLLLRNPKVLGYNVDCRGDCMAQCTRCWVRF